MKPHLWFSFLLGLHLFCAASCRADAVAFFYALDRDLDVLKQYAEGITTTSRSGTRTITHLRIAGHDIDAIKMGSGCVESALSAQALFARKTYDLALSAGPAGGLSSLAGTGLWYRIDRVVFWQKGGETPAGFRLNSDQVLSLNRVPAESALSVSGVVFAGTAAVASGEAFITSATRRDEIRAMTGADLVDMNSGGMAAACADHQTPLVILRIVSDHADESASQVFRDFADQYDGSGGELMARIIAAMPPNPDNASSYPEIRSLLDRPTP